MSQYRSGTVVESDSSNGPALAISWLLVGIPLTWGVVLTLINATKLFR